MTVEEPFRVIFASSAVRDLDAIPPRYAAAVIAFVTEVLPGYPARMGKPLRNELNGLHGARRGEYRVLYEILAQERVVVVMRIDHRASAYRRR